MAGFEILYGKGIIRFLYFFNYPKNVTVDQGEKWYFEQHVPAARFLPGLVRFRTWKGLPPIKMYTFDPYDRFVRVSELAFQNLEMCLRSTIRHPGLWKAAAAGQPGFNEFECIMLHEQPQYDLLKDIPVQQYKYAALIPQFTGEPEYDESDDAFLDVYMLNYRVPVVSGEDWYLGHHVREGRHTKMLGNKHYMTWKGITVPDEKDSLLKPNRFYRLTELGLPEWARGITPRPGGPPKSGLKYTFPAEGSVLNEWRNILIDPKQVQDIL